MAAQPAPGTSGPARAQAWRRRLVRAACIAVLAWLALEAYVRWPSSGEATGAVPVRPGTHELVLIVHGSFGDEEPALRALEAQLRGQATRAGRGDLQVVRYRWSPWSDNILRAAPHAERIGTLLGRELAAAPRLARLHLVAHSAGAYMLDPLCEAWRGARAAAGGGPVTVRMTFLDPIGLRGLFERGWGAREFGRCADAAEAYINTDDSAPATDRALRHARTVDVTHAPGRERAADGHRWPIEYYLRELSAASR
jgi:hypothetical protein